MTDLSRDLHVFTVNRGSVTLVEVGGELDLSTVSAFEDHLELAVGQGRGDVVVDMSQVAFCDSRALCALVAARHDAATAHRGVRVINPSRCVERLLQLTSLQCLLADPA